LRAHAISQDSVQFAGEEDAVWEVPIRVASSEISEV